MQIVITENEANLRLDRALTQLVPDVSRSEIQAWIKDGKVQCENKVLKASEKLQIGQIVEIEITKSEPKVFAPENIPLDILFEDEYIMVINKKQGMVVHPGAGHHSGTLVNALMYHSASLSDVQTEERRGIVHRLDKDTSGLLIVAKTNEAHQVLSAALAKHEVVRIYETIVYGFFKEKQGLIDAPIARDKQNRQKMTVNSEGRKAVTHFRVIASLKYGSYLRIRLETGRTHQIRAHMKYIGHPVVADPIYAAKRQTFGLKGQCLHARGLAFHHPITGEYMHFEAPLPDWFEGVLETLGYQEQYKLDWEDSWLGQDMLRNIAEDCEDDEDFEE